MVGDDDPIALDIVAGMLEDLGYKPIKADGADEALRMLADNPRVEVLVSDINMPGIDGYELMPRAKQLRRDLKMVGLSGAPDGGRGFPIISKPFNSEDLRRAMEQNTRLC